jgi:hypothetical protein
VSTASISSNTSRRTSSTGSLLGCELDHRQRTNPPVPVG